MRLDYAEALTRTPAEVTDPMMKELSKEFDTTQLVELTALIAS